LTESTDNFKADPQRQAIHSIGGYVYQIHQSVFAWFHLKENEILVLEGAEDFDVHSEHSVTITQVKNKSQNITLNTNEIQSAINNFWKCKKDNPEHNIHYRFLTTANSTFEKGNPFGTEKNGIDYWNEVANSTKDISTLRNFLKDVNFNPELLNFLTTESDDVIRNELINCIKWNTGSKSIEAIQHSIEDKVTHYGLNLGVDSRTSKNALSNIFKYIAEKSISKESREVTKLDLQSCFEKATMVTITHQTMMMINNKSSTGEISNSQNIIPILSAPPAFVEGGISRKNLVIKLVEIIESEQILFICGSNGYGKTNLALLLSNHYGDNWKWLDFRGIEYQQKKDFLFRATFEINNCDLKPFVVIDDLDFIDIHNYEKPLLSLIFTILNLNGRLVITSNNRPPVTIFSKIWRNENCEIIAPEFNIVEIEEAIKRNGLTEINDLLHWAKTVNIHTLGHPQLVHVLCRNLDANNWPKDKIYDFEEPEDIERIKEEARKRLTSDFPDEKARKLAYRLSILNGSFTRETALSVAQNSPSIDLAGEAFDLLVGPWIEHDRNNHYRISQLLKGAAEKIFHQDEINLIHGGIASNIMIKGSINQNDLSTALFHAYKASKEDVLLSIGLILIKESSDNLKQIYDYISWFSLINLENSNSIISNPKNCNTELVLRLAQFKLLSNSPSTQLIDNVLDKIDECINCIKDPELKSVSEYMAYGSILHTINIHINAKKAVSMISRLIDISDQPPDIKELNQNLEHELEELPNFGGNNLYQVLFSLQAANFRKIDDLLELIKALEELPESKRNMLLEVFKSNADFSDHILSSAWLCEDKKDSFDFDKASSIYKYVEIKAREWELPSLIESCLMTISIIYDEYAQSKEKALIIVNDAVKEFPNAVKLVNQKAKVLLHMDRALEAKPFVEKVLSLPEFSSIDYMFCCRLAGKSFAKISDWNEAAKYFNLGALKKVEISRLEKMGVGLLIDAAFCWWKDEKFDKSLLAFADALDQLKLISYENDMQAHHLHATVRHCITWIHISSLGKVPSNMSEPVSGMCSNQDPHEKIQTHEIIGGLENMWSFLEITELNLELNIGIKERAVVHTKKQGVMLFDNYTSGLKYEFMFKQMDFENAVPKILNYYRAFNHQKSSAKIGNDLWLLGKAPNLPDDYWNDSINCEQLCTNFLRICLICIVDKKPFKPLIQKWQSDIAKANIESVFINELLDVLGGKEPNGGLHQQVAWGIRRLKEAIIHPKELWEISFRLLNLFLKDRLFVEHAIEGILISRWFYSSQNQMNEFSEPNKNNCTLLQEKCLNQEPDIFIKIAEILNLTAHSLNINLAESGLTYLKEIIKNERKN